MAYKDIAYTTEAGGSTDMVFNMPATAASGDRAICVISQDGAARTHTPPAGWESTALVNVSMAGPDAQTITAFEKRLLSGSEGSTQTFTTSHSSNSRHAYIIIWSGRNTTSAPTFVSTPVTSETLDFTSPITHSSITTGTAVAGDDLLFVDAEDKGNIGDVWEHSNWSNSFVERGDNMYVWQNTGVATLDNVSAGAFGNVSVDITRTTGVAGTGWTAFVIAIPSSGSGSPVLMGQCCT